MSNPSGGGGGLIALGIGGVVLYVYAGAIILGLTVLTVNSLFVYRLYKMQASEEETRHGKATRAFLGFLLIIFVQYFLYTNSTLRDGAADQQVVQDWYQKESGVFGTYYLLIGVAAFVLGFITVKSRSRTKPRCGIKVHACICFCCGRLGVYSEPHVLYLHHLCTALEWNDACFQSRTCEQARLSDDDPAPYRHVTPPYQGRRRGEGVLFR